MRIIGYPKYIVSKETQDFSLRNCPVVIDGQNYLHFMYENSNIPYVFGCEADKYAQYLKCQFKIFKQANVKCYIVFKGGDTDIQKKIEMFSHLIFDFDTNTVFVPPIFIKDATVQMVDEMGMNYAFCVTEHKDECVALAQKLECPIISFDIEYCFRKAPYIPSITMNFDIKTKSIQCRQYKLQDFLHKNSMTEEKTAMFAALSDSTVFPMDFFDTLLQTWGINIRQYLKFEHVILWLSKHSEQEARDGISKSLSNDDDRNKFWLYYHKMLTNMRKDEAGHVTEYLLNSNIPIVRQDPEWFEKGVVCKYVSQVYINLYKWKVIEGSWDFEITSQDHPVLLSIDIIKYAYNLLTNYRGDTFKLYQDASTYKEIDCDDTNVRKPNYNCSVSVFENGWDQVKHLKLFEYFLNENNINTEVLSKLQPNCVVLFITLVYFARRKQLQGEDVTREVYAVLLSYVMLSLVFNRDTCCKDWQEFSQVKSATGKYFKYNEVEAKRIFDAKALSSLMELQYCIQHMNYLNTLCGSPYESTQYRKLYNGTFVYKVFCDMREYGDCEDFVNELFQMAPTVSAVVKDLFQVYRELLMSD